MLYTKDLKGTVDFYTGIFGFECRACEESQGWAAVDRDGLEIMFALPNEHIPFEKPAFTGSFYINTDDVDAIWEQLKGKCHVGYEPETFAYGMREFAVYDNNGYLIQFGQPVN